jgi:methylated-DNA-[protein]-cysteine S-methyltransferase
MTERSFSLFETPIGPCGIVWGKRGIVGVQLPEANAAKTRKRIAGRFSGASETTPPREVKRAIAAITKLLHGEKVNLSDVSLDMDDVPEFHQRIYRAARSIAPGKTLSYGEVAKRAGSPGAARAVGQALGRNPFAIVVPCHRVLAAGKKIGGFSADGGTTTKLRMLAIEGAEPSGTRDSFRKDHPSGLGFDPKAAVKYLKKADTTLARTIDEVGPFTMELKKTRSVFGALAEAIVYQQLSGKAAETIFGRVCALFPGARNGPTPAHILGASDVKLRGAGLSRAKTLALRDLAEKTAAGAIPSLAKIRRMNDDAIVECLTEVRGIGRWTAEMLLMFRLGRPDVLPVDDFGIRKGFAIIHNKRKLPAPKALAKYGERWKPYRTVASWYLWRATDL